jgi:hypothetical protein
MTARWNLTPEAPPLEDDIHENCARVLDRLLAPPAMWFCYPAGHIQLSAGEVARLVRRGLKRSLPDIWLLHNGVYLVELKREGGKLSQTRIVRTRRGSPRLLVGQAELFPALLRTGAITAIAVCHSVDELLAQVERWGIPLRGRIAA